MRDRAAGFIGHHLCRYLKEQGYWVRGVDWKPPRKLTEVDVYEILTRLADGEKAKDLAEEYPVSYVSIRSIACRNSWRHVQWP